MPLFKTPLVAKQGLESGLTTPSSKASGLLSPLDSSPAQNPAGLFSPRVQVDAKLKCPLQPVPTRPSAQETDIKSGFGPSSATSVQAAYMTKFIFIEYQWPQT